MTTKELFIGQWQHETTCTMNAIKSLPDDMSKLDYKPHPKSRSARDIMEHILPHVESMCNAIGTNVIREEKKTFNSKEEMAAFLTEYSNKLIEKLATVDEKAWETTNVDFIINQYKTITLPMVHMFYIFMFDTIHHRGQLSTFYRAMGARNPNIYGPSAEDIEEMMAAMSPSAN